MMHGVARELDFRAAAAQDDGFSCPGNGILPNE